MLDSPTQISILEVRPGQVSAAKVRGVEGGAFEDAIAQVGTVPFNSPAEIGAGDMHLDQVGSIGAGTVKLGAFGTGIVENGAGEVRMGSAFQLPLVMAIRA